jgi:hypothetical protein
LFLNADVNGDGAVNTKDLTETAAAKGDAVGAGPTTSDYPLFQLLAGVAGPGNAVAITQTEVQALLPEAIAAWQAAGLSAGDVRRLESVRIQVGDLGTSILGLEAANVISINQTAAGYNWYTGQGGVSGQTSGLASDVDLLTVLEHELGHVIGLADTDQAGDLMDTTLALAVRRAPASADVAAIARVSMPAPYGPVTHAALDAALASLVGPASGNEKLLGSNIRLTVKPMGTGRATASALPHLPDGLSARFAYKVRRPGQASVADLKRLLAR